MLKIGFSTCHACSPDYQFLNWTAENIDHLDYDRFEVCVERTAGPDAVGSIDDFIQYPVLEKLNALKIDRPEWAEGFRALFSSLNEQGKEVVVWAHEIACPPAILEIYPELATARGDLDLSNPLLAEWMRAKYQAFFDAVPQVGGVVLVLTEVAFPAAHRFDNAWSKRDCLYWLIKTVHDICVENGKKLIVRPFSAIVEDYRAAQEALSDLPEDIEIMVKTDPFDWNPFLPLNPALAQYPPERLTVEFDLGAEYFGRGVWPVVYPGYIKERIDYVNRLGIKRIVGRLDRRGISALDREGRLNVDYFYHYARGGVDAAKPFLIKQAERYYRSSDYPGLVEALCDGFEVVKKTLYSGGQLLWHRLYGDITQGQTAIVFDTLRDRHDLAHGVDEWHILENERSLSIEDARDEKRMAVQMAEDISARLRKIAPTETGLLQRAEAMLAVARLYEKAVVCIQEYCLALADDSHEACFLQALDQMREAGIELSTSTDQELQAIGETCQQNVDELAVLFPAEKRILTECPDVEPALKEQVIDVVTVGYPGEGHQIQKHTHGSRSQRDGDHCWRTAKLYLAYTVRSADGETVFQTRVNGSGNLVVTQGDAVIASTDWDYSQWTPLKLAANTDGTDLKIRIERLGGRQPCLQTVYVLKPC